MSETKTALEEIKSIEAQTRKISLIEVISELKDKAKEIKRLKFYTDSILNEMWYDVKEVKSIIDYINSQTSIDESKIEKEAKKELENKKERAEKKINNSYSNSYSTGNTLSFTNFPQSSYNAVNCVSTWTELSSLSNSDLGFIQTLA